MVHKATKLFILLVICFSFSVSFQTAFAEGDRLIVATDIGFDNKVKRLQGFPITVKIVNNGPDISGELVISVSPGWNSNFGNVIAAVDIPANSEKTVKLSLPGLNDANYNGNQSIEHIRFYEGGWQNGKEVKLGGQTTLNPRMYNENDILVGLLTDLPDAFQFLKTVKWQNDNSYSTIPIDAEKVPTYPIGLGMFNFILIDQYAITELSMKQQEALKGWVSSGGTLIVGGGDPGVVQKLGQLAALLPMATNIKTETSTTEFFNKKDRRNYPTETIELITGTIGKHAQVIQKTKDGTPVVINRPIGKGGIVQLAFSPSGQTFANWDGASSYWLDIIQPTLLQTSKMAQESIYDQLSWLIGETTNLFPSSFLPFPMLVFVFLGYVLLIFPTLYFILRKIDKREHSWWVLPVFSLVISGAIFGFGGKDRIAQPQINEVTILQLNEQGLADGYGSLALLSNHSGNYQMNVPVGNFYPFPLNNYSIGSNEGNSGIRHQGDQLDILFKDVGYWSIRNVSGPITALEVGNFEVDIKVDDKKVTGSLTNKTKLSFHELLLLSGRQEVSLGAIGPGETIDISFELKGSIFTTPALRNQYTQTKDINERRRADLLQSIQNVNMYTKGKPALLGLTKDSLLHASIEKETARVDRLNLIVQALNIGDQFVGPFTLKTYDFSPEVYMVEGNGYLDNSELMRGGRIVYASSGVFEFSYQIPEGLVGEKTTFSELSIKFSNQDQIEYEIFNTREETYEPITDKNTFVHPEKYVNEYGSILIRIKKGDLPEQLAVPEVTLKGELKHD